MAGRKKPISGKQKREQLQHKRAAKAAATNASTSQDHQEQSTKTTTAKKPLQKRNVPTTERTPRQLASLSLESRFLRLPAALLAAFRTSLSTQPLPRPISSDLAYLRLPQVEGLTCPSRPKWSYNSTKKEVEKNEEGVFRKWLDGTDQLLRDARRISADDDEDDEEEILVTPTFFERNLQVWRQLWRVCEASEILLILLDVRMPLLHYPPSLKNYVRKLRPKKKLILVLTKTDLVPESVSLAWKRYFEETEALDENGACAVVLMESYKETTRTILTQGTQPRYQPSAPLPSRLALLSALKLAHQQLLTPPEVVANSPEKLERWEAKVRQDVDWDSVVSVETLERMRKEREGKRRRAAKTKVMKEAYVPRRKRKLGVGEESEDDEEAEAETATTEEKEEESKVEEVDPEPWKHLKGDDKYPFITIGLIGQPNVGKSSLLNALLSHKVVRASRTPGKTKALQTIYWNETIRLCDCPGLVCPSAVGMENQVLAGILPIQNVELVTHFVAQRLRLEAALGLDTSSDGRSLEVEEAWSTDSLLTAFAQRQGFITAKAGRPDITRAGALVLRQLHASVIPWAFLPPHSAQSATKSPEPDETSLLEGFVEGEGIWLRGFERQRREDEHFDDHFGEDDEDHEDVETEDELGSETASSEVSDDSEEDEDEVSDEEEADEGSTTIQSQSGFAALALDDGDAGSESDEA